MLSRYLKNPVTLCINLTYLRSYTSYYGKSTYLIEIDVKIQLISAFAAGPPMHARTSQLDVMLVSSRGNSFELFF